MTPELQAAADAAIAKAVKAYQIAVNGLTEQQTCEAFKQAIACGDFQRHVLPAPYRMANEPMHELGAQKVVYVPFMRAQELERELYEAQDWLRYVFENIASEVYGLSECHCDHEHDISPCAYCASEHFIKWMRENHLNSQKETKP